MAAEERVREVVGTLLMMPAGSVSASTSLAGLQNSIGEAKLRLALKRLGLRVPAGRRPATFAELCDLLAGKAPAAAARASRNPAEAEPPGLQALTGLAVGLDVQDVASLPAADDYWEDPFYAGIFGKPEIAYAVLQPEPRTHFAGFWCAKEALRKCDPAFADVEPSATVVAHEAGGRPYFLWKRAEGEQRLPHALSISHVAAIAMAIVVSGGSAG